MRVSVLGGGSWGTTLALHLLAAGHRVTLWLRNPETAEELRRTRRNEGYLPDIELPVELEIESDLAAMIDCDVVLMVVPSHGYRQVVADLLGLAEGDRELAVVSATKGIETESLSRMSAVTRQEAEARDVGVRFGVLSGPTFASELVAGVPSAAVIASDDETFAEELREGWSFDNLRLYSSADVAGVEVGGSAKNVIAIAAGIVSGVGLGHNALAALITRGLHEMTRLGVTCGGEARTFAGLAGLGDLVLTCTGDLSRNRQAGMRLARGRELGELTSGAMVAEGLRNALSVSRLAGRLGIEMPIVEQVEAVIYEQRPIDEAIEELMGRERKTEGEL